jgi:hypothetical protein
MKILLRSPAHLNVCQLLQDLLRDIHSASLTKTQQQQQQQHCLQQQWQLLQQQQ